MRSSFTANRGLKLSPGPSVRDQTARRRLVVGAAFIAVALAGVGLGLVTAPNSTTELSQRTGPFSYFPSE